MLNNVKMGFKMKNPKRNALNVLTVIVCNVKIIKKFVKNAKMDFILIKVPVKSV